MKDFRRAMRRWILTLFALLLLPGQLAYGDAAEGVPGEKTTLRVGWYKLPGYMEIGEDGQYGGYLYDYLQAIIQQTGWSITFVQGQEQTLRYQLRQGTIDLLAPIYADDPHATQVLLCDLSVGTHATTLYTRVGGSLGENDYEAFDGVAVGVVQGSREQEDLLDFSLNKGFTPRLLYFSDDNAIREAVRTGKAEAGVTLSFQRQDEYRQLAAFANRNFYFAVCKNKPEIARQMNEAIAEIQSSDPSFNQKLAQKYAFDASTFFTLTLAEREYLQSHPTLTVAYGRTWEPLLLTHAGADPTGVAVQMLSRLTEMTGIQLRYVPLDTADHFDLLCCLQQDYELANQLKVRLSTVFLTLPIALISADGRATSDTAATLEGFHIGTSLGSIPKYLVPYSDARACLEAVRSGAQPAALLNTYMTDILLRSSRYQNLLAQRLSNATVSACLAVQEESDPRLLSILNKLIQHLGASEMNDFIISTVLESQSISLETIASQMPQDVMLVSFVALGLFLMLMALVAVLVVRRRRERAQATEIAAFLEYATKANDDVWELDGDTRDRWRYRVQQGKVIRTPMQPLNDAVVKQFIHPDDLEAARAKVEEICTGVLHTIHQQERFEFRMLTTQGYHWMRFVFLGMLPNKSHPHSAMAFITDVDDAVRSEEQKNQCLRDALDKAEQASSAKTEFTAYLSHEIRSPLNAVLGYLAIAKNSIDNPRRLLDCFAKSEFAANHLLQLINDVLDMGSITSGQLKVAQNRFDLRQLLDTLASIYGAQAQNKGIQYAVIANDLSEPYLIGDDLRMKQVVVNLLSNAMKFTPKGGKVTLSISESAAAEDAVRVRFVVSDTGIGMSETFQQNLFRAYVQQDETIAARFGGTGLGLNIAKRLVDLLGGTITVQSAPGEGTTFTVEFPLPVDRDKKNLLDAQPDSRQCFSGKRLLLVEDNDMNMEIATELLRQEGDFAIDPANNGREAVRRFLESPAGWYDAVLMDVRMPEMDGYQATRAIRASDHPDAKRVPIIAMTADAFAEDVRQAMDAGMNGHIPKPIDIHRLLVTLADLIASPCN